MEKEYLERLELLETAVSAMSNELARLRRNQVYTYRQHPELCPHEWMKMTTYLETQIENGRKIKYEVTEFRCRFCDKTTQTRRKV